MGPADSRTNSYGRGFDIAYSYRKRSDAPFPHAIVNTQLFLDYPNAGSHFDYRLIPITVNCYGQHAIARRGGLARFAAIADERLDPSGPTPARCFALGRAVAQAFRDTDSAGGAGGVVELVARVPDRQNLAHHTRHRRRPPALSAVRRPRLRRRGRPPPAATSSTPVSTRCSTGSA